MAGKHRMFVLSREGDTCLEFDPAVEEEVKTASDRFHEMTTYPHRDAAFAGKPDETPVQIREFDPSAEETTFVPPICGGQN
jgi:hypothetical protein